MHSKPWFRSHDGWWYFYCREGGKRRPVKLVQGRTNKAAAFDRWHDLCREPEPARPTNSESVVTFLDVYLDWVQKNRSAGTYGNCLYYLQLFASHVGPDLRLHELKPKHVTAWLDEYSWADSTKAGAIQIVRSAFQWLEREGHIDRNPVSAARGPSKKPREVILTDDEWESVIKHSRDDFRDLLHVIRHTGCRPQEAVAIEATHVDLRNRRIVFPPSEAKGKRHPRVIYLDDVAYAIVERCCRKYPRGPILRNAKGKPFQRNMVRCRFRRLRPKVGASFCAYHLRHTFATNALQRLDPITVATLMGHQDASTLAKNYQHLAKLPAFMQEAAKRATREGA